jgi:hypothetical protein
MATSKKSSESVEEARRRLQLQQLETAIEKLSALAATLKTQRQRLDLLQSVSAGLYEELDKLAKKSPADEISPLGLEHVNELIRDAKELSPDDLYMQRCKVFVPAGDNPQHRDVVMVLRQIRQGLDRFNVALSQRTTTTSTLLADARGLRIAVLLTLQGVEKPSEDLLETNKATVSNYWLQSEMYGGRVVNLRLLDRTDIPTYFAEPE